jgi:hypothetical protein
MRLRRIIRNACQADRIGRRTSSYLDRIGIASLIDVHQFFEAMSEMVMN